MLCGAWYCPKHCNTCTYLLGPEGAIVEDSAVRSGTLLTVARYLVPLQYVVFGSVFCVIPPFGV